MSVRDTSVSGMRAGVVGVVMLTALGLLLLPAPQAGAGPAGRPDGADLSWEATWNLHRRGAGVPPAVEDPDRSAAAAEHAEYAVRNQEIGHSQDPTRPGASDAGAEAAARSNVSPAITDVPDRWHLDNWMSGPFHQIGMLRESLRRFGYGSYADTAHGFIVDVGVGWVLDGFGEDEPGQHPFTWPGHGGITDIHSADGEYPEPTDHCGGYPEPYGPPLSVIFAPFEPAPALLDSSVTRVDGGRVDVEHCAIHGPSYTSPDQTAQDVGRAVLEEGISLVPREPLAPSATYEVVVETAAGTHRWTFHTTAEPIGTTSWAAVAEEPAALGVRISQSRFAPTATDTALLARDDDFADALAGTALSGDAPLLLTRSDRLADEVADELRRVVEPGGTVLVLGGPGAVGAAVVEAVEALGLDVRRLAGPSRVETAVAVLEEVQRRGDPTAVALARAGGPPGNPTAAWADSVSAGAWLAATGTPLLLTGTESLHPAAAEAIADLAPDDVVLLGGEAALSAAVAEALPAARRIAGTTREGTAVAIATDLLGDPDDHVLVDGYDEAGWTGGLAAAGLAADLDAAVLLTSGAPFTGDTADLRPGCRATNGSVAVGTLAFTSDVLRLLDTPTC